MPSEHRLHPSSILFALASSVKSFALLALLLLVTAGRGSDGPPPFVRRWVPPGVDIPNWQFWLLLFLIPSVLVAIARYLSFRLRYEGTEIVIRSGVLFRNERHVPYLRIQNLDAVRNVAHRLLGVTEVRVETGGGNEPEATIKVLHDTVFEEMRRRVFAGRARASSLAPAPDETVPGGTAAPQSVSSPSPVPEARTLLHLPMRELLLHGFLENRGIILVAAAYGLLFELGLLRVVWSQLEADGWYAPGIVRTTLRTLAAGERLPTAQIAVLVAGIAGLVLLVRVVSMAWAAIRLHDFRLVRLGDDLRTEYGLLTRVTTTIPMRRVQTLTLRQGPLQRLVGRMSVRVETAGGHATGKGGGTSEREWLAPIVRSGAMPDLVREVLPAFELDTLSWEPVHPRAFRRAVKPALLIGVAVTAPFVGLFGWRALAVLPFALAWMTVVSWKHVRQLAWAVTEQAVVFRSGWLWRLVTVASVAKIQAVACMESPFDRRTAMARVRVDTAGAGDRSHRVDIPYLARETATALHARLAAQASRTAFRW
jgi:putative membrane protein